MKFHLKKIPILILTLIVCVNLNSCGALRFERADVKDSPINEADKRKRNIEEGRGFSIPVGKNAGGGGNFSFASSNELWRATLDILEFAPLSNVDYGGRIIITDWYSDGNNLDESVKISIRFLTNEVRTDALDIIVFYKKCNQVSSCKITKKKGSLVAELKKEILSKAAIYKKENKDKKFKPYQGKSSTN